jgi:hypothetical protein
MAKQRSAQQKSPQTFGRKSRPEARSAQDQFVRIFSRPNEGITAREAGWKGKIRDLWGFVFNILIFLCILNQVISHKIVRKSPKPVGIRGFHPRDLTAGDKHPAKSPKYANLPCGDVVDRLTGRS